MFADERSMLASIAIDSSSAAKPPHSTYLANNKLLSINQSINTHLYSAMCRERIRGA